jgi:hypothetical protein
MKKITILLGLILILNACKKNIETPTSNTPIKNNLRESMADYQEGETEIGGQLQDPYTIANMQLALDNLTSRGITSSNTCNVNVTHKYIKFKPETAEQLIEVQNIKDINLTTIPMDHNIIKMGNRFHDPSIAADKPTPMYASVPADYKVNVTVPYDIVQEHYIPEEDASLIGAENNESFINQLLDQAYIQTGNYEDTVKVKKTRASFFPGGKIQIKDTRLNTLIGLEGVLMKANRWFTTHTARTDASGNYRMTSTFARPCNYSLEFNNTILAGGFSVTDHWYGNPAGINGPKLGGDFNFDILNGYDRFCGHIFRGAFRYHFQNTGGLMRPFRPSGNISTIQAKDAAKNWQGINWTVFPVIRIARFHPITGAEWESDEIFSTTCHELSHTAHVITMNAGIIQFNQVSDQLQESWATAVEWSITKLEYVSRGITNYGSVYYFGATLVPVAAGVTPPKVPEFPNYGAFQMWKIDPTLTKPADIKTNKDYTTLFINLVENFNESLIYFNRPDDQVSGYTLSNIENVFLKHCYGLNSLKTNLKANKPTGVTDAQIDLLLNSY